MKKNLIKIELFHYDETEKKILGANPNMIGNCSGLRGNCTYLKGDCTGLWGDCIGLWGDCTGLKGDCTGLRGNLDSCEITDEERKTGIDIQDLIGE